MRKDINSNRIMCWGRDDLSELKHEWVWLVAYHKSEGGSCRLLLIVACFPRRFPPLVVPQIIELQTLLSMVVDNQSHLARPFRGQTLPEGTQYWKEATVLSCEGVAACTRLKSYNWVLKEIKRSIGLILGDS